MSKRKVSKIESEKRQEKTDSTQALPVWISAAADGVIVSVHAQPGAKRNAVVGLYGNNLKIALTAPPVEGKANAALQTYIAEKAGVSKNSVLLVAGQTSRAKRFLIKNATAQSVAAAFLID